MDTLSEVLRLSRFAAQVTLDATAAAPWCVSVAASSSIARAHLVIDGRCELKLSGDEPVTLNAGEIAFIPNGEAHLIGHPLDAEAKPLQAFLRGELRGAVDLRRRRAVIGNARRDQRKPG